MSGFKQPPQFGQQQEGFFGLIDAFGGYISKAEVTNITPNYLVKGSKNVLVDYSNRVISRPGYTLYRQVNTGAGGIKGSYEWDCSTGQQFSLRAYDTQLEFSLAGFNSLYNTLLSNLVSPKLEFAKVLDFTEQQDVLLFVLGDGYLRRWSGGVSKVASTTGTTLTKQGVLTAKTTIAFVAGTPGSVAPTITDSANGFVTAGFAAGDTLNVTGSTGNSRQYTVGSVTAGTITLIMTDVLVAEAVGTAITLYNQTGPTWKAARFFSSASPRSIMYNGTAYTYTGGETTDTLTGLTAFPAVTAGDPVWQSVDAIALPSAITSPFPNFFPNLIGAQLNMVFLASTSSSIVFSSSSTDYTDFTLSATRAQGDPIQQPLTSGPATCIVPIDGDSEVLNIMNTLIFGSGRDAFDQLDFHMSQDNSEELVRVIRYKTALGSGLISKDAICPVKNNTVYISREPVLDYLSQSQLEGSDNRTTPISDPIKNDFDGYDFTDAHVRYWKRALFIALPNEGLVLIYDLMRNLWQPPQTIPISRFGIVDDQLIGHSAVTNETYQLFIGTNDNGARINFVARFAYNNGGRRDRLKNQNETWSDGYISTNGLLSMVLGIGFEASVKKWTFPISGLDTSIVTGKTATPLGNAPFGTQPLGGANINSPVGSGASLYRFQQIDTVQGDDYLEQYVEYNMNTLDGQFAIVAYGSDQYDAGTSLNSHKK